MKGLNDYIKEVAGSADNLPKITKILQPAGWSVEMICKELKSGYNTTHKEAIEVSNRNESFDVLIMQKYGVEYHRFYISRDANEIMNNLLEGLKKIPLGSYFDSPEYKQERELQDAKARASGFKNSADLTKAYWNK